MSTVSYGRSCVTDGRPRLFPWFYGRAFLVPTHIFDSCSFSVLGTSSLTPTSYLKRILEGSQHHVNESICFHDVKHHLCSDLDAATLNACQAALRHSEVSWLRMDLPLLRCTSHFKEFIFQTTFSSTHDSTFLQSETMCYTQERDLRAARPGWHPNDRCSFYHQKSNSNFAWKHYKTQRLHVSIHF